MKATEKLHAAGQSLWLDNITRDLLTSGTLKRYIDCLLYTSDAADDSLRVDLGGRRIIKKKNFFKQKTAYEISECLVGSEMCIRDRPVRAFGSTTSPAIC